MYKVNSLFLQKIKLMTFLILSFLISKMRIIIMKKKGKGAGPQEGTTGLRVW